MDFAQAIIFDVGWVFFGAWTVILAAVALRAFGRDLFGSSRTAAYEPRHARPHR
jgi:hypothetical protein